MFKFAPQHGNMSIDMLIYGIENHFKYKKVPYWYFVTKGLKPDCVFYLNQEDDNQDWFTLYEHVCGIEEFHAAPPNVTTTTSRILSSLYAEMERKLTSPKDEEYR